MTAGLDIECVNIPYVPKWELVKDFCKTQKKGFKSLVKGAFFIYS